MTEKIESKLLWEPSEEFKNNAGITRYMEWLSREKGHDFADYAGLWEWSVTDLEGFWTSIWEYGGVKASESYSEVLKARQMPGAMEFPQYDGHVYLTQR